MKNRALRCLLNLAVALLVGAAGWSAQTARRPLAHKDYASWRSIVGQRLSPDGRFAAYFLFPQEGDGELVVRELATGAERREPAGERPPPPARTESIEPEPEQRPEPRGPALAFTSDSRTLVFSTYPSRAETEKARKEKKKPEEMPKGGLVIMNLAMTGSVVRVPGVKDFQAPEDAAGLVAYHREAAPATAKPDEPKDDAQAPAGPAARGARAARPEFGSELVLRKLADGGERTFADVVEYSLSRDGGTLVYAVASKQAENNGVYSVVTAGGDPKALLKGRGKYSKLSWDENQTRLAFLSDRDDSASKPAKHRLYGWKPGWEAAEEWVSAATPGFREGFVISDKGAISFSKDGQKVFFGCAPPAPPEKDNEKEAEAAGADTEEKVLLDLWHWKDDFIQPMQKARATQERERSYRAVFDVAARRLVQLADATMPDLQPSEDGRWGVGSDDREYRRMVEYDARYADLYAVDTATGARHPLVKKHEGSASLSPDGAWALVFTGRQWHAISIPGGKDADLTGKLGVNFWDEEQDTPGRPAPYGSAGWTKDGKWALLYDRFDVWQVAPDGGAAWNLTAGSGRRNRIQLRVVRLETDPRRRHIDPAEPVLLRAEDLDTRDSGFYEARFGATTEPKKLVFGPRHYTAPAKAKNANVLLLTASTFSQFPDLLVTDSSFRELRKASDANPQKAQLLWGTGELMRYKNLDGVELQAALYKPENFDPSKKHPMLVYIYERLSQAVNAFVDPRPGTTINISYYVSNGYVVLTPDIIYTAGYPGQSALKCVLPAIQAVVDRGFIDEKAIGIQGHSWGGYQIAYMVTQTNRFRAAEAGAPVANMTSAYDGIRWGPGRPRQFQYEQTQSRIGGTLWEYPSRFLENSPIFMADRVKTPLMILHNDADDAVPWYQGIEYFLALRRLGKEVYLFNYNGEPHGIRKRADQKDYTVRMQQFFDHYLKGAPAPEWMTKGVPYLDREKEKERMEPLLR